MFGRQNRVSTATTDVSDNILRIVFSARDIKTTTPYEALKGLRTGVKLVFGQKLT